MAGVVGEQAGLTHLPGHPPAPRHFPSALELLADPESFDPLDRTNIVTAHLRSVTGAEVEQPDGYADDEMISQHWVDYFVDRVLDKKDTIAIIDGEPREGKSNFALWLAAKVRQELGLAMGRRTTLDLQWDVIYDTPTLLHRMYRSSREDPGMVVVDEGALAGFKATSGISDLGGAVDTVLSIAGINGCSMFILHPNIWGLAAFVRNRRAKVYFHVEHRGLSTGHHLKTAIEYAKSSHLPFMKVKQPWARVRWPSLEDDPHWAPLWREYEERKKAVVQARIVDFENVAIQFNRKMGLRDPDWVRELKTSPKFARAPGETTEAANRRRSKLGMARLRAARKALTDGQAPADTYRTYARART